MQTTLATLRQTLDLALAGVSARTAPDYRRGMTGFVDWLAQHPAAGVDRVAVISHLTDLRDAGVPVSSLNQRLAAIKRLTGELAALDLIDPGAALAIRTIKSTPQRGQKTGRWLTGDEAATVLAAPDVATLRGLRDRAILAVMLGAGLRRSEVCALRVDHLQQRNRRWVILNLAGKHHRTRTIPLAPWTKELIDAWTDAAGIRAGLVFRAMRRGGIVADRGISGAIVWQVVAAYTGGQVRPHDLRRTFAKLSRQGGASLEQLMLTLGHAQLSVTQKYLGVALDYDDAPADHIQLPGVGGHA